MSAAPFMQLYVGDYLGDTQHLTTEEHGAYLLLLMAMWRAGGSLPNDAAVLARVTRLTPARWRKIAPGVLAFFVLEGETLTQRRLRREIERVADVSRKRSRAGREGAAAAKAGRRAAALGSTAVTPLADATVDSTFATGLPGGLPRHGQSPEPEITTPETRAGAGHGPGVARPVDAEGASGDATLAARLLAAGGAAIDRRAGRMSVLSEPLAWLAAGCDLERDILPVIAARCRDRLPDSVQSWSFFTAAITEARDRRLMPLPPATKRERPPRDPAPPRTAHDVLEEGLARALGRRGHPARGGETDAAGGDDPQR